MGILNKLFGTEEIPKSDLVKFGRFSDNYKSEEKYTAWDESILAFEKNEYLKAFKLFLDYLQLPEDGNVVYTEEADEVKFTIYQGSKKINGYLNSEKLFAEAKIAKTKGLEIGFLRRLLEQNFELKHTSYALDEDDQLTMVYDAFATDSSPFKNYYALKELAITADKQDDILIDEFDSLETINTGHVVQISDVIKKAKYDYLIEKVNAAIKEVNEGKLNIDQYPGGISYLLLDLVYKCDYLLKPEGRTMEVFEKIHKDYHTSEDVSSQYKNREIIKALKKLLDKEQKEYYKEFYTTKSTFGVTTPSTHDQLVGFIDNEIVNLDWYQNNRHATIAQAIPGFIVGYCLFNFSMPIIDKELMHLYYEVVEYELFEAMGISSSYVTGGKLNSTVIKRKIKSIINRYKSVYPNISPNYGLLDFSDMLSFAKTFMLFLRHLNLTKV